MCFQNKSKKEEISEKRKEEARKVDTCWRKERKKNGKSCVQVQKNGGVQPTEGK